MPPTTPPVIKPRRSDPRTPAEIWQHYTIEKELSDRLRAAPKDERRKLYTHLYDEICERVPNIPQWNDPLPAEALQRNVREKVRFLRRFVPSHATFLELGPGDCSVAIAMAGHARQVYAVDVSTAITRKISPPENFQLLISDGVSVDVPPASVDVAYSNQLMEHLHPEDAQEQLENVVRALKPGGTYICITPSRLSGPHDVSKYFDSAPTGFHLREYSTTELARVFREAGFQRIRPFLWLKGRLLVFPLWPVVVLEALLDRLPSSLRRGICNRFPVNRLLGRVVARTPGRCPSSSGRVLGA